MRRDDYRVFSVGRLGDLAIKNRLIRSATYECGMTERGEVTPVILDLYRNLANGGVGAIITGHMAVRRDGQLDDRQICIYEDSHIAEISRIADAVHGAGTNCRIIAQLSHTGRQVPHDNVLAECVGPSAVPSPVLKKRGRELTVEEIQSIVGSYVDAIVRVRKAGYDGVQLHAAHGYLLSSFLSPYTNRRNDEYGGAIEKRLAILREIIVEARRSVGTFPILIKMNCTDHVEGGIDGRSFPEVAAQVSALGFDAIEVSGGMWDCLVRSEEELGFLPLPIPEARTRINSPEKQSYFVECAGELDLDIPVIVVGGHRDIEAMEQILIRGKVDFLSLSRPLVSEPHLPNRWLEGTGGDRAECVSCNSCLVEVKVNPLKCVLKQNRLKQKIVKNTLPRAWRLVFK